MISNESMQSLLKTRTWLMWGKRFNRSIHSHNNRHAVQSEIKSSLFKTNKVLAAYAERRRMVDAHRVFDSMPERNVVSWTVMRRWSFTNICTGKVFAQATTLLLQL